MKLVKLALVLMLFLMPLESNAVPYFNSISQTIRKMNLQNQSTVAISVKNVNGHNVYDKNAKKLLHPASSLKVFTFAPCLKTLGENYKFSTAIYLDGSDNLYIKLGADPLLKTSDLRNLIIIAKKNYNFSKVNKIYIDDTIIDKTSYPDGWLVDDFFPNMPMVSPYTLNQNKTVVKLYIPSDSKTIGIMQQNPYKHSIINEVSIGILNDVNVKKINGENNDIINIEGTLAKDCDIEIPVSNPKYHFIANLMEIFEKEKITYQKEFYFAKTPANLKMMAEVSHSIGEVGRSILKFSDNLAAEIVFKVAGGKFKNKAQMGSTKDGVDMFYDFYKNLDIDTSDIKVVDGSGVSRYNMLDVDWMSSALVALNEKSDTKNYLAQPDEGTLNKRLRHMRGKLWAKTGTLNGVSALCGYITTRHNKNLVFSIIISNFSKKPSVIKGYEDDLIDAIWEL